ncbi:aspartate aminotransferase family protein [Pseudomonas fulva]|nr:aspartate aminotransferase family protein [Pseudomonas fulva]MBF8781253.1 aspartate aminotransferase family protein [Pseudomonas fulva]
MNYPEDSFASRQIYTRACRVMPGGNTRTTVYMKPFPLYAVRGQGCRVWDADGVERIDCINNFTAMIHGYCHPEVDEAVKDQLALGTCFGMPTESEIELAQILCERLAGIDQVRFTNSGTEAVMMALKAARAFTGRGKIAKVEGAYHGSYDYAEVSLDSTPANWGESVPISTPYAQGTPEGVLDDVVVLPFNNVELTERILREQAGQLAAVLVDPMPNRAGLVPATAQYMECLARITKDTGTLLIFDEVISFRLGYHGAQGIWGVTPDLTTLGKIIGGGFPIGAVGGRAEVMRVFDPRFGKPALPHGGTFSANPVSMRAGVASLRLLDETAFERLELIGSRVRDGIDAAFRRLGIPGHTTGRGSLLKVHFTDSTVADYRSAYLDGEAARRLSVFNLGLLNRGVLTASYGLMALSTCMTDADIDQVIAAADGALHDVAQSLETAQAV